MPDPAFATNRGKPPVGTVDRQNRTKRRKNGKRVGRLGGQIGVGNAGIATNILTPFCPFVPVYDAAVSVQASLCPVGSNYCGWHF